MFVDKKPQNAPDALHVIGGRVPLNVDDFTLGCGSEMFPEAVNTNHRCRPIWHRLAASGCVPPVWEKEVVGAEDGAPE